MAASDSPMMIEEVPGSRPRVMEYSPPEPGWDVRPLRVEGLSQDVFLIGDLAKALGRRPQTIREWEAKGILPKPHYRTHAAVRGQRRLYTRFEVEALRLIAIGEGILTEDGDVPARPRVGETKFAERARRLWSYHRGKAAK